MNSSIKTTTKNQLLSITDICTLINRDRRSLWRWVTEDRFPQPLRLNGRTLGWNRWRAEEMNTNKKAGGQTPASKVCKTNNAQQQSYTNNTNQASRAIGDREYLYQGDSDAAIKAQLNAITDPDIIKQLGLDTEPALSHFAANEPMSEPEVTPIRAKLKNKFKFTFTSEGYEHSESWLIKGVLPEQAFGIVYGNSGSYKSFCVLDWVACISTGRDWMRCKVAQGTFVYVAAEGVTGFKKRVKAWEMEHNENQPLSQFAILGIPVFLDRDTEANELVGAIRESVESNGLPPPKLVVFDTLSRCLVQSDENSAKEMNTVIRLCQQVQQQLQVTVILVHHSGKDDNKGARGSSILRAARDFEFKVSRKSDLTYQLDNTKAKDSESMGKVEITLYSIALDIDDGEPVTTLVRPRSYNRLKKVTSHGTDDMEAAILSVLNNEHTHEMPSQRLREDVLHMLDKPKRSPAKPPKEASQEEHEQYDQRRKEYSTVLTRFRRTINKLFNAGVIDKPEARTGNIKLLKTP
jgi:predicted DNA-binding transcriptional regulator AlpA